MALYSDTAVVLRRLDYSETSQVLAVLTRLSGQQRLIAKGVKRSTKTRVAVGVDLLELGAVVYSRRPGKEDQLATLTEWRQLDHYPCIRRDLTRWYAAQYAAEAVARLTEPHDPHIALFDGLRDWLGRLADADVAGSLVGFLCLLLREIGLQPEWTRCAGCGGSIRTGDPVFFASGQGGVICRDCEPAVIEKRRCSPTVIRALASGERMDPRCALDAVELVDYHLSQTLSAQPRLSRPLMTELRTLAGGPTSR